MRLLNYINARKEQDKIARILVSNKIHPDADGYDIEIFRDWLKMAIKEGPERIKVVVGAKPNTWTVTVLDKKET